jgi:hypothetical protein
VKNFATRSIGRIGFLLFATTLVAGAMIAAPASATADPLASLNTGYTLTPASSSFETVAGTSVSVPVTVTNTSAAPITIGNFFTQGAPNTQSGSIGVQGPQNLTVPVGTALPVVLQMFVPQLFPSGDYFFQICAGGSQTPVQCASVELVVDVAPDFSVSLAAVSATSVVAGGNFNVTVSLQSLNGYTGNVSFFISENVSGPPSFGTGSCDSQGHCVEPSAFIGLGQTVTTSFQVNVANNASLNLHTLTLNACSGCGQMGVPPIQHSTGSFPLTVTGAPDFSLSGSVAPSTVAAGGSVSATVTVAPINDFGGTVSFNIADSSGNGAQGFDVGSCDNLGNCVQPSITGGGTTAFQIDVAQNVAPGTYDLFIVGNSGCAPGTPCVQHKLPFTLTVLAAPDFGLSLDSIAPTSVYAGGDFTVGVTVSPQNGFGGTVSFYIADQNGNGVQGFGVGSCDNLGNCVEPSITGGGTTAFQIDVAQNVAPGTYDLFIVGNSGCAPGTPCVQHDAPFTITVQALAAPTLSAPTSSDSTSVPTIGSALPGALVTIYDATTHSPLTTTTADGSGIYNVVVTLPYGASTIAATQTVDGTESDPSAFVGVFVRSPQAIVFGGLADHTYGDAPFAVSASGGPSGNPVTFTATGSCSVSGATVSITGAGSCTVTANQVGNTNYQPAPSMSRSFAIADAARAEKQAVLNQVNALLAGASKHDQPKLSDAAKRLTDSLSGSLWVDPNRLDPKHGNQVFDDEKAAWQDFQQLIGDKKTSTPDATLQALADRLVSIDRGLAQLAISDAANNGGDPKQLAAAQKEFAAGDASAATGRPDAIDHYKNAWTRAGQSLR